MNVATIPIDTVLHKQTDGRQVVGKEVSCTCGWKRTCVVWRSENMTRHHLLYEHGGGSFRYGDNVVIVEQSRARE